MSVNLLRAVLLQQNAIPGGITSLEYLQPYSNTNDLSEYTFTGCNFGAEDPNRHIIVVVGVRGTTALRAINNITIGGISATFDEQTYSNNGDNVCIARALVPTGSTGTIVVTVTSLVLRMGIHMYRAIATALHPYATSAPPPASSVTCVLDIPAGGYCVAAGVNRPGAAHVYTGITKRNEIAGLDGAVNISTGMSLFASASNAHEVQINSSVYNMAAFAVSYSHVPVARQFPSIISAASYIEPATLLNHPATLPAGLVSGNLLLSIARIGGATSAAVTFPAGWNTPANNSAGALHIRSRTSNGTEGVTAEVAIATGRSLATRSLQIANAKEIDMSTIVSGTTGAMPSLTAYWGPAKTLWIAVASLRNNDFVNSIISPPAGFTDMIMLETTDGAGVSNANDAQLAIAFRQEETATMSPGNWGISGTLSNTYFALIAVKPKF